MDVSQIRDDFQKTAENGPVEKWEREVKTPSNVEEVKDDVGEHERGSAYMAEENRMVAYVVSGADHIIKVAKIGTMGWSTSQYTMDGELVDTGGPYFDSEEEAHNKAREIVEEVAL